MDGDAPWIQLTGASGQPADENPIVFSGQASFVAEGGMYRTLSTEHDTDMTNPSKHNLRRATAPYSSQTPQGSTSSSTRKRTTATQTKTQSTQKSTASSETHSARASTRSDPKLSKIQHPFLAAPHSILGTHQARSVPYLQMNA